MPPTQEEGQSLPRRIILRSCIGALLLASRSSGQSPSDEQHALDAVVRVSSAEIKDLWQSVVFEAACSVLGDGGASGFEVRLKGVVVRTSNAGGVDGLRAFCLLCPHEGCLIDYEREPTPIPLDQGVHLPEGPLLVCNCHFSVFDPRDGALLSGPARHGLFPFTLRESGDHVEVVSVDKKALG